MRKNSRQFGWHARQADCSQRALNRFADTNKLEAVGAAAGALAALQRGTVILKELSQILGVFENPPEKNEQDAGMDRLVGGLMQLLIELRADARKAKNFAQADLIRKRLSEVGVTLEDGPGGTRWRRE